MIYAQIKKQIKKYKIMGSKCKVSKLSNLKARVNLKTPKLSNLKVKRNQINNERHYFFIFECTFFFLKETA